MIKIEPQMGIKALTYDEHRLDEVECYPGGLFGPQKASRSRRGCL
jgi:hypothetical protein